MKDRLPVDIENLELPTCEYDERNNSNSYGYVSILSLLSLLITTLSVLAIIFMKNR